MENKIPLPEAFCRKMKALLGQEYETFIESYEKDRSQGLRLNPLRFETFGGEEKDGAESGGEEAGKADAASFDGEERSGVAASVGGEGRRAEAAARAGAADAAEMKRILKKRFGLRPVPWTEDGYYYESETRPGRHPYHDAGLYYIQEPSAMAVAELLEPRPGERILDLCAAPGGKSTQIAGKMRGRGLLVSNEIHPERARILSQNMERMGIGNAVVTNETPERLSGYFPEFFDRILADAPCSGEGMFRKDEAARQEWSPEHVAMCVRRQADILDCAARMLRPGGRLVYSTCTFAPEENEGSIRNFLKRHGDFSIEKPFSGMRAVYDGFSSGRPDWVAGEPADGWSMPAEEEPAEGWNIPAEEEPAERRGTLADTVRIWPHKADGEGHYIAVLRKKEPQVSTGKPELSVAEGSWAADAGAKELRSGDSSERRKMVCGAESRRSGYGKTVRMGKEKGPAAQKRKASDTSGSRMQEAVTLWNAFCRETLNGNPAEQERLMMFGEQLYLLPEAGLDLQGIKVLRPGLHLGTIKKDRLEPSHALALWLRKDQVKRWYSLSADGPDMERYLRGETLEYRGEPADGSAETDGSAKTDGNTETGENGWVLVLADGYPVGWAKLVGGILKNHYPKGLRTDRSKVRQV